MGKNLKKNHDTLDLYSPIVTTMYACVDGEVNEIYYSESYGNRVNIKGDYDGKTYWFFYAHLSETSITAKDKDGNPTKVKAGDIIGKTGQTGNASGQQAKMNHLHFEVRSTSARTGGKLDPLATIEELKNDVITNPDKTKQTGN
ncbi:M23 family metallopeptidase [Flavobacterium columnare]|uniref:M23 family metallopeptidase n=1 Tax=Flavobacterium columnare TaxID=996 RepID=UPI001CE1EDC2|nr:M23 family metallopeptidase [Flavobacterium columnare]